MKNGKISEAILKRSVLKQIHNSNEKVLVDSKVGNDCGIIDISHSDAIGTASSIITLDIHNMNLLARIAIFLVISFEWLELCESLPECESPPVVLFVYSRIVPSTPSTFHKGLNSRTVELYKFSYS